MDASKSSSTQQAGGAFTKRRSSGTAFEGLMNQKRSSDPIQQARRQSLHEQRPQAGFFGQMWHNFTRGPASPTK